MIPSRRAVASAASALALVAFFGCGNAGGPRPALGKVHGTVKYNGQPFTKGSVTFLPVQGKGGDSGDSANGPLDSDGSFELTTFNTGDGAVAGQHTAIIQVTSDAPTSDVGNQPKSEITGRMPDFSGRKAAAETKPPIPEKYTMVDKSPLKFTVEAGKDNVFEINLKD